MRMKFPLFYRLPLAIICRVGHLVADYFLLAWFDSTVNMVEAGKFSF